MASFSGFPACYLVVLAEPQVAFGDMLQIQKACKSACLKDTEAKFGVKC